MLSWYKNKELVWIPIKNTFEYDVQVYENGVWIHTYQIPSYLTSACPQAELKP